jgi:hypothetical protein
MTKLSRFVFIDKHSDNSLNIGVRFNLLVVPHRGRLAGLTHLSFASMPAGFAS